MNTLSEQVKNFLRASACRGSEQSIAEVEQQLGVQLPLSYRKFLALAGGEGVDLFDGDAFGLRHLVKLQAEGRQIYKRAKREELKPNFFIFTIHQNYSFYCIHLDEGDNPPVYMFIDGDAGAEWTKTDVSFESFLIRVLKIYQGFVL